MFRVKDGTSWVRNMPNREAIRGGHKGGGARGPLSLELCECCTFFLEFCTFFLEFWSFFIRFVPNSWKSFFPKKYRPPLAEILWPPLLGSLSVQYIHLRGTNTCNSRTGCRYFCYGIEKFNYPFLLFTFKLFYLFTGTMLTRRRSL